MKFKVNPLFFALALALVAFGHALDFVWTLLALLFHEGAHALMARARGYVVKKIVLLPYGAMMSAGENFDKTSSVLIGLAGPCCNIVLALVTLGLWWLYPASYPYTIAFLYAIFCPSIRLTVRAWFWAFAKTNSKQSKACKSPA